MFLAIFVQQRIFKIHRSYSHCLSLTMSTDARIRGYMPLLVNIVDQSLSNHMLNDLFLEAELICIVDAVKRVLLIQDIIWQLLILA